MLTYLTKSTNPLRSCKSPTFSGALGLLVALLSLAGSGFAQVTGAPGSPFAVGTQPVGLVAADFNQNGKLDLAIVNSQSNSVTIILDNLTSPAGSPFAVGNGPAAVVAGDFNGDGKTDLAVANSSDNTITILIGDGTGAFTPGVGSPFAVGTTPKGLAVGDFNRDGKIDLAVTNSGGNAVQVLLGNGAGSFSVNGTFAVGGSPTGIAVGDFNQDGNFDVAVANSGDNTVSLMLGDGTGNLSASGSSPFSAGTLPVGVIAADFNNDGKLDIAVANAGSNNISVLLGNGSGGFSAATGSPFTVSAGAGPISLAALDVNGDGNIDVVSANLTGNSISVLTNDGTGVLSVAFSTAVGTNPTGIVVTDLNQDGKPDIATANQTSNDVSILLNTLPSLTANPRQISFGVGLNQGAPPNIAVALAENGASPPAGTFTVTSSSAALSGSPTSGDATAPGSLTAILTPTGIPAGSFSGTLRFNAPNYFGGSVNATLQVTGPSNTLTALGSGPIATGSLPTAVKLADLNHDGKLDLVVVNNSANTVSIFLGNGDGTFSAAVGSPIAVGSGPASVAIADFNRDGFPDLAVANTSGNSVSILLGNGTGAFSAAAVSPLPTPSSPFSIIAADFNNDGLMDIAVTDAGANNVAVALGNGFGGFTNAPGSPFAVGTQPAGIRAADLNGDGNLDLVVANEGSNNLTLLQGNGLGGFTAFANSPLNVGTLPVGIAVADLNGDGKVDIAAGNFTDKTLSVFVGAGDGTFTQIPGSPFAVGTGPIAVEAADINGDGLTDVAVVNSGDNTLSFLVNGTTITVSSPFPTGNQPNAIAIADLNGDGLPDVVVTNGLDNNVRVGLGAVATTTLTLSTTAAGTLTAPASIPLTATLGATSPQFSAGTGSIVFSDNSVPLGTVPLTNGVANLSQSFLKGAHSFTATYAGDLRNTASATAAALNETVVGAAQTITFAQLPNATFGDSPITLGATASSTLPVSYAVIAGNSFVSLNNNVLTILGAGTVTIEATQAGNTTFAAAPAVDNTFTINQESQTITFAAIPNHTFGDAPFTITPTASSGQPVALAITAGNSFATLNNGTVTIVGAGSVTIQATQAGTANFSAAPPVSQTFTINQESQTITFAAIPNHTFGDAPFTITPTASSGQPVALAITAGNSFATLNNGTVTIVGAGSVTIQATQAGTANFSAAAPVSQSFTINQQSQTINFPAIPNQTFGAGPIALSATGGGSGNPVTYGSVTGPATLSAGSLTITGTGLVSVTASQVGNANYSDAAPVTVSFTVNPAGQNITFGPIPNHTFGDPAFTLSATGSNSGIPIVFAVVSGPATIAGNTLTITGAGTVTVNATQAGNANYNPGSAQASFVVNPATQTINFPALPNVTFGAVTSVNLSATGGASGNPVTYGVTGPASVAGSVLTINGAGTINVTASQAGNANYSAATQVTVSFTVNQAAQVINFAAIPNYLTTDPAFTISATGGASGMPVTFAVTAGGGFISLVGNTVTILGAGNVTITASQAGSVNYSAATPVSNSFTISLAPQTITFSAPSTAVPSSSVALSPTASSGLPVTLSVISGPGNLSGNTLNVTGVGAIVVRATQAGNATYAAAVPVTRTITALQLNPTISWNPAPMVYGTPLGTAQLDAFASVSGTYSYSPSAGTILPAGTSVVTVSFTPSDPRYTSTSLSVFVVVAQATQTINFPTIAAQVTSAAPFNPGATASSGLPIAYTIVSGPAKLAGGLIALTGTGSVTIQAAQSGNGNYMAATPVTQTFAVTLGPVVINSVLNAASYASGPMTAGSYAVVFGSGFSAGGTDTPSITITDSAGTLTPVSAYYVSPGQLNILVPNGLAAGTATLTITNSQGLTGTSAITIASAAPAIFTADSSGKGVAAGFVLVLATDGSVTTFPFSSCGGTPVTCTAITIPVGSGLLGGPGASVFMTLFGTGFGNLPLSSIKGTIGGTPVTVTYAGPQGTYPGLSQINILLPNSLRGAGLVTIQLTANGVAANPVMAAF